MRPWSLISPASRGIGQAIARHVLQTTNVPVVATARKDLDKAKEAILRGLEGVDEKRLTVLQLNVLDESTIAAASSRCAELFPPTGPRPHHLHLAFFLPGILRPEKSPAQIDAADALLTFRTNTLGPMLLAKHFAAFLPGKKTPLATCGTEGVSGDGSETLKGLPPRATVAVMSARVGSISDNALGGWYSYRASKAAVNQVVKTFDNHLKTVAGDKAVAVGLHPGTVKTDFTRDYWAGVREGKLFEREWVAERLIGVLGERGLQGRGRCWDWKGEEVMP